MFSIFFLFLIYFYVDHFVFFFYIHLALQERAVLLFLRYASRWANEVIRGLSDVSASEPARHCVSYICPCQFIERHLKCKPQGKFKFFKLNYWISASERYD